MASNVPETPTDLPPGWEAKRAGDRWVYVNHITKTTQWEKPIVADQIPRSYAKNQLTRAQARIGSLAEQLRDRSIPSVASDAPPPDHRGVPEDKESLPSGWESQVVDGRVLYIDHVNQSTTYTKPTTGADDEYRRSVSGMSGASGGYGSSAGAAAPAAFDGDGGGEPPLPPGWTAEKTADGKVCYVNHNQRTTTWERQGARATPVAYAYSLKTDGGSVESSSSGRGVGRLEAPLPTGWSAKTTLAGSVYYVNHLTKTTTWERPAPNSAPAAAPLHHEGSVGGGSVEPSSSGGGVGRLEAPLPTGWSAKTTLAGAVYYVNHLTKTTTWERPAPNSAPAAAPLHHEGSVGGGSVEPSSSGGGVGRLEAPLPTGWSAKTTLAGSVYYENHLTKTTTWERPAPNSAPAAAPLHHEGSVGGGSVEPSSSGGGVGRLEAPLPTGWKSQVVDGRVLYIDHVNQSTTYTKPTTGADDEYRRSVSGMSGASGGYGSSAGAAAPSAFDGDGGGEPPLPPGWTAKMTDDGVVFYVNHNQRTTAWKLPEPDLAPAAAATLRMRTEGGLEGDQQVLSSRHGRVNFKGGDIKDLHVHERVSRQEEVLNALLDNPQPRLEAAAPLKDPCERSTPHMPGGRHFSLVNRFDSSPETYCVDDLGIRLHVRYGCLLDGQCAGPVSVNPTERFVVACGGSYFLVSAVVDCQPPGPFQAPLDLDFRVGEEEEDDRAWSDLDDDDRQEYIQSLRDTHEVLKREEDGGPWTVARDEDVSVVYDEACRAFFVRAKVHHFSQGCLARKLNLQNNGLNARVSFGRPSKKELEFINATDKPLMFLVLPTSFSQKAITSIVLGAEIEGVGVNVAFDRALEQAILSAATECQVVSLAPRTRGGDPAAGEECPHAFCSLSRSAGSEAMVALVTVDGSTVFVWFSCIFWDRTRYTVLPAQFSAKMNPIGKRQFAPEAFSVVDTAGMSNQNAPISSVSSRGDQAGAHSALPAWRVSGGNLSTTLP